MCAYFFTFSASVNLRFSVGLLAWRNSITNCVRSAKLLYTGLRWYLDGWWASRFKPYATDVAIRGHWGHVPLGAYSVTQKSAKNASKHVILTPKTQKIFAEGARPLFRGEGTPFHTLPLSCPHYN